MKIDSHQYESYIGEVLIHIKSKAGKKVVKQELIGHLHEKTATLVKNGVSEELAVKQAITEMGDPLTLGRELNKMHKPKTEWFMLSLFIVILAIGLLPMYTLNTEYIGVFQRKLFFTVGAFVLGMSVMFFPYEKLKRYWEWFFAIGFGLLLVINVFDSGPIFRGRFQLYWFDIRVDMLVTLICFFIAWAGLLSFAPFKNKLRKFLLCSLLFLIPLYLFGMIPHFFYGMMYVALVFSLFIFSKESKKFVYSFISLHSFLLLISVFMIRLQPHQIGRLEGFFSPEGSEWGYIYVTIREGLSSASWFGAATENYLFKIPDLHTDFIFVYFVLTFGWLIAAIILTLFFILFIRIGNVALKTNDLFGKLLVVGGMSLFFSAFTWNVGMVLGILPIMSATFPFLSYGGSQQLLYGLVLGIILSVYRRSHLQKGISQATA